MKDFIRDWAKKEVVTIYAINEKEDEVKIFCYDVHYQDLVKLQHRVEGWHVAYIKPCDNELIEIQLLIDKE